MARLSLRYLQDQLSLPEGEDLEAEIHLFEVIPGGTATDIARHEAEVSGLGAADEATLSQLQPLTNEAASVLLGKPALGRALRPGVNVRTVPPGQRVYHMVVGRRPVTVAGLRGRRRVRRLARVYVIIDAPNDQIRVLVFLSEVKTQRLAVRLRQQTHAGAIAVQFQKLLAKRLPPILHGRRPTRLRIVHPGVAPGADNQAVLGRLPALVPPAFVARLQEWLTAAFADFVKNNSAKLLAASEDPRRWRHARLHDRASRRPERTGAGAGAEGCRDREHRRRDRQRPRADGSRRRRAGAET